MTTIVLFHSVLGLRQVEMEAADRMRALGHTVVAPDLYAGLAANSMDEGFAIMNSVGWKTICRRAQNALDLAPETAVLAGHSMGAGVIGSMWPGRPMCDGVVLLHGLAEIPQNVRHRTPIAVHVADPDPFAPPEEIAKWTMTAKRAGVRADIFSYPTAGHFYTDRTLPDFDQAATEQTWARLLDFLSAFHRTDH
ncbi:MAG TPA: dienelactone hydrolase family protein [Acetobacteraceae bacterium]